MPNRNSDGRGVGQILINIDHLSCSLLKSTFIARKQLVKFFGLYDVQLVFCSFNSENIKYAP